MNGLNKTIVPSTHYPPVSFTDEANPFPIQKEIEPMKLTIKTQNNQLEEYNLWFAGMEPTEMSSMDLIKAVFDIDHLSSKMSDHELALARIDLAKRHIIINAPLQEESVVIDDNYLDARNAIQKFVDKLHESNINRSGEDDFSSLHAHSTRVLKEGSYSKRINGKPETVKYATIDEMYVSEMTGDKYGWVVEFKSATINSMGQHYKKTWPGVLFMNKTQNGYRLMWVNKKTKTPIWAIGYRAMANKKLVPANGVIEYSVCGFRDALLKQEDVLKILKWMPLDEGYSISAGLYPYGITQSDIYWVGAEVSTKKILNKAYKNPHGVTKKIFGDINNIKTFDELRAAIALLQIVRGFNPQVLEKLDLKTVTNYMRYTSTPLARKHFKSFFRDFGHKDEYLLQMFTVKTNEYGIDFVMSAQNAVDAAHMFTQIKSRTHRTAIKQHVTRSRMNVEEIHDFVNQEYNKIKTENKKLPKNKFSKAFAEFDGKWIAEGIQMITPKMTHDLVEWGAIQNNCIGSYADRVYNNHTIIIGFKDIEGEWIGHAEIQNDVAYIGTLEVPISGGMTQLLGKHNQPLAKETRKPIVEFLKNKLNVKMNNYWGE